MSKIVNSNKNLTLIIPVKSSDFKYIKKIIPLINKNISPQSIVVISGNEIKEDCKHLGVIFYNENKIFSGLSFFQVKHTLEILGIKTDVTGWYLQQFLKLGFALSKYAGDYYLSWDSDTLPLHEISFFKGEHPLFTPKKEYNPSYFTTIKKLFGLDKIVDYSFIAEHMLFKTEIVKKMLDDIMKSSVVGDDWIEKILNAGDYSMKYAPFSEFETYGTYCMYKYPDLYHLRHLCTFRFAGYIRGRRINDKLIADMAWDLDIASFEIYHGPMFPYNLTALYYKNKQRYFRYRRKSIKELLIIIRERLLGKNIAKNDLLTR